MNVYSKITLVVIVFAALLASTQSVFARPAEAPEVTTCRQLAASVDIPSRWADYMLLKNPSRCTVVAGVSTVLIPNTGLARKMDARFSAFKDRQAEERSYGK